MTRRIEIRRTDGLLFRWVADVYNGSSLVAVKLGVTKAGARYRAERFLEAQYAFTEVLEYPDDPPPPPPPERPVIPRRMRGPNPS